MTIHLEHGRWNREHAGCCGGDFALAGAQRHYPPDLGIEPVHLEIELHVEIDERRASGVVRHHLRANRDGARTLTLHAVDLDLREIDSPGHECTWTYDGQSLALTWAKPFAAGETRTLAIDYVVEEPVTGLFFSGPSPAYPDAPRYAATDHETERARHWLPTVDHPSVRPSLEWRLRGDADHTILANGLLVSEHDHQDGTKTSTWKLDQPCPSYLTCFVMGDLVRHDGGEAGGMELAWFTTADRDPAELDRAFDRTADMVSWMTRKLDRDFPYPKYYQFALPGFGGAMENISLVSWDDIFLLDETLAKEWKRLVDQINVHEMAHAYFGNLITCRDFAHAWLKESWATYMESCWFEHDLGPDERDYELYECRRSYFEEADTRYMRPIVTREFNSSWDMYDMHLYPGGGVRLHMLRNVLGDDVFWEGVRLYVDRFQNRVVETDDFRRVMEEVSGRSLGRFFDQWFHTAGYPHLVVEFDWDVERSRGTFTIEQKQVDTTKKGAPPVFELELELAFYVGDVLERRTVLLERAKQSFAFTMADDPQRVRVDPGQHVVIKLDFNPGRRRLRNQLEDATDVVGRILAGAELAKTGKPSNLRAIGGRWEHEPFWGVRVAWSRALGAAKAVAAIDVLVEVMGTEEDPRVLEALFRACSQLRDDALVTAIENRLEDGLPYRATQAAYEFLGAQREQAPVERLADAAADESYGGITQVGALRGLAESRTEEALDVLLERVAEGNTSNRARPAAVVALGSLARVLDRRPRERAVDRLTDLLRDPNDRVRAAAVKGLGAARAVEATAALEQYRQSVPHQEQVGVDRMLASIRGAQEPRLGALEKQLEEMRAHVRTIEDRLERLAVEVEGDEDEDDGDDGE